MAQWLDKTFYPFDREIFSWVHALQQKAGGFFNGFCKFVSVFGELGWAFILLALIFLLFRKTRRSGLAMGFALLLGAIVTNILLKNIVGRARPFTRSAEFAAWWADAGKSFEDSASFPSGHTTAAFASMVALCIAGKNPYRFFGLVFALLMAFSRVYLIVHYPTDVLAGMVVGTLAGVGGALLCRLVYKKAKDRFADLLQNASVVTLWQKLRKKSADENGAPQDERNEQTNDGQTDDGQTDKNERTQNETQEQNADEARTANEQT